MFDFDQLPARARQAGAPHSPAPPGNPLRHAQQRDDGASGGQLAGVAVGDGGGEALRGQPLKKAPRGLFSTRQFKAFFDPLDSLNQ